MADPRSLPEAVSAVVLRGQALPDAGQCVRVHPQARHRGNAESCHFRVDGMQRDMAKRRRQGQAAASSALGAQSE